MGRPQKQTIGITDLYPGLNDIGDAFEALPQELVRYFTLLKEIDAKCVTTVPHLKYYIKMMLSMEKTHPKRKMVLSHVQQLLKELMPCLEEKMHVASIASDAVCKHLGRIDDDWDIIVENEIPESVRIGPLNHPAMIQDSKLPDGKSTHSARSESRREALAAKRGHVEEEESGTETQRNSPGAKNKNKKRKEESEPEEPQSPNNEPLYCYCNQVSYGEMVGCDGSDCAREWFHLPCIGLTQPPRGKWYCDECKAQRRR